MARMKMGIGPGLWYYGTPYAATPFASSDQVKAWDMDSIWLSAPLLGTRQAVAALPMMATIAARTQCLTFGSSAMMPSLRHLMAVPQAIATLDLLSQGCVIIAMVRKLWAAPDVSQHGKSYQCEHVTSNPRLAGKIALWMGGRRVVALRRAARLADDWCASRITPQGFAAAQAKITAFAAAHGREHGAIEARSTACCHVAPDGQRARRGGAASFAGTTQYPPERVLERSAVGSPEACRATLRRYVEHGLTQYALWPACPPSPLLPQLAHYAQDIIPYFEPRAASLTTR